MIKKEMVLTKDLESRTITVVREFDASLDLVWKAWTESEILDEWWAPKPFKAVTKQMDFRAGGRWLYLMQGPDGSGTWCCVDFGSVEPQKSYTSVVGFCDEAGNRNMAFPVMEWSNEFNEADGVTTVRIEIYFENEADMHAIIGMGFEEGFKMGLGNLDEYLQEHVSA